MTPKQLAVARAIAFRDAETTDIQIADAFGTTARTLRRWKADSEFQEVVKSIRSESGRITLSEALARLSIEDQRKLAAMARDKHRSNTLDVEDELAKILQNAKRFKEESEKTGTEWRQTVKEVGAVIRRTGKRVVCLATGEDPNYVPSFGEIKRRLERAKMVSDRVRDMKARGTLPTRRPDRTAGQATGRVGADWDDDDVEIELDQQSEWDGMWKEEE